MQAATHLATGAVLGTALPRQRALVVCLAALSHPLLDAASTATYHPADPLWDDPFWIAHQVAAWVVAGVTAWWLRAHGIVLLAAMVPDLDWLLQPFGLWEPELLHETFAELPGISSLVAGLEATLPNVAHKPLAALVEVALYSVLAVGLLLARHRQVRGRRT